MRYRRAVLTLVAAGAIVGAFLAPLIIDLANGGWQMEWQHLADIGQAYGSVSAVLSAFAVVGVAAGLLYQTRALRLSGIQSIRSYQRDLFLRLMDDPQTYVPALGENHWKEAGMRPEQFFFLTLWFNYIHASLDAGVSPEWNMREDGLRPVFAGELGRRWWQAARWAWLGSPDASIRRVGQIAEDEYQKAVASGPPTSASEYLFSDLSPTPKPSRNRRHRSDVYVATAAGAGAAAIVSWLIVRARRR
jgi:uncharacterized protein DUF6082